MTLSLTQRLTTLETMINHGLTSRMTAQALDLIGINTISSGTLIDMRLYSEYLPKAGELGFTEEQRYLHFLWDSLDKSPACLMVNFAMPLRRVIAKKLFKWCGKNFMAEENVRFNFGQNITAGDDVFINRGTFLDAKGGIIIGNSVGIAEGVSIFTHNHSESNHAERSYAPVIINDYAKLYSFSLIGPGVTIGKEAIVGAKALVTKDVEPGVLVAGIPAKPLRKRKTDGKKGKELNHIWLNMGVFQNE